MHVFTQICDLATPYVITSRVAPSPNAICLTDPNRFINIVIKQRGEVRPLSELEMQVFSEIAQNVAFHESLLLRGVCYATEDDGTCTKCKDGDDRTCPVIQNFRQMIPSMLLGKQNDWHLVRIAGQPQTLTFVFENPKNYSMVTFDLPSADCANLIFEVSIDPHGHCWTPVRKFAAFLRRIGCLRKLSNYYFSFQGNGLSVTERRQDSVHQWNIIDHPDFNPAKFTGGFNDLPMDERPARYRAYVVVEECH